MQIGQHTKKLWYMLHVGGVQKWSVSRSFKLIRKPKKNLAEMFWAVIIQSI